MHLRKLVAVTLIAFLSLGVLTLRGQQVTKQEVAGIRNLARLETTVACSGAVTAEAIPEIKKMGFVSIINLRLASEPGADVEEQAAAAKAIGLKYFHVPFDGKPDPVAADRFLAAITSPGAEPAFIHCGGGNRAATMWLIKRLAVDGWDADRATQEAIALGQTNVAMRQFAIDYAKARQSKQQAPTAPVNSPTYGDYATADIRVITPGVVFASGMPDLAAEFTKQTGKKVGIVVVGMGTIVAEIGKRNPPPDVVVLPFQLMNTLSLNGGAMPGTMTPVGRNRMGLAVRAGAPKPDISTVEKLAAALKSAKAVMRSNPASRTMVALLIDDVLKRPEFAGVNAPAATGGSEGGQALARGEGDMAIQTISQILPYKEIELVGPLPEELGAWIDTEIAVSTRATHAEDARALIRFLLRPESNKVWKPKGLERFE